MLVLSKIFRDVQLEADTEESSSEGEASSRASASEEENNVADEENHNKKAIKQKAQQRQTFQVVEIDLGIGAHANVEKYLFFYLHVTVLIYVLSEISSHIAFIACYCSLQIIQYETQCL